MIAISAAGPAGGPGQTSPGGLAGVFWQYSLHLSIVGWSLVGISIAGNRYSRRSQIKSLFAKGGFAGDVYDLMIGMRGGGSRLALLRGMEEPRHRQELSEITGIDWKEVDRQVSVLERYGLVKMHAKSGTIRMYQVTEQGKLLLKLIGDLQSAHQTW